MTFMACSNDEATNIDDINKQTVIVFMPWSGSDTNNGLYDIFLQNLDSIESAIKTDRGLAGRLVVYINTAPKEAQLYEVTYDNGVIRHTPITSYSGTDYTTSEGITRILNDVKANAYALNYTMMIGCHGTGWTYKEDWQNYPYNAKTQVVLPQTMQAKSAPGINRKTSTYPTTRFFGSASS